LEIADRIRALRRSRKVTQVALADRAGIDLSYYRQLEAGRRRLNVDHLQRLASALGVDLRELMPGDAGDDALVTPMGRARYLEAIENALSQGDAIEAMKIVLQEAERRKEEDR